MYAYIEGTIVETGEAGIVLDCGGIGYDITMSASDMNAIARHEVRRIYTCFSVSENGVALYGFLSKEKKQLYLMLNSVNGVGPKAAIAILGTLDANDLKFAIASEDVKSLSRAPGIGAKTAKRIILDLKDKLDFEEVTETRPLGSDGGAAGTSERNDAIEALVALGYSSSDAFRAVTEIGAAWDMKADELIRLALASLA